MSVHTVQAGLIPTDSLQQGVQGLCTGSWKGVQDFEQGREKSQEAPERACARSRMNVSTYLSSHVLAQADLPCQHMVNKCVQVN